MGMSMEMGHQISAEMMHCVEECQGCHDTCLEAVGYCLQMGGEHAMPGHIRLLMDCAEICQTSANFMIRMSDLHTKTCGVCAEVCERCAKECARFDNDSVMQRCAETCTNCARSCHDMSGSA